MKALARQPSHRFARCTHHEDAATVPFGSKGDAVAIRRIGGLGIVGRRRGGQVDGVLPTDTLGVDVHVARHGADVGDRLPVRRKGRKQFGAGAMRHLHEFGVADLVLRFVA